MNQFDSGPWTPQTGPQSEAISARSILEMLYGGAVFGGKTDFLLGDFLQDVPVYQAAWRGVLFRRTMGEMDDIISRSMELYPRTGAFYNGSKFVWRWPNGASLRFRYLEQDKHRFRYHGAAFTWLGWDELTLWPTDLAYRYLRSRLRSAHNVPFKRIRSTTNPGGPGHNWVKSYFIGPAPGGFKVLTDPDTGIRRVFIPSRLTDNLIGLKNDPDYARRLRGSGSKTLVKALLEGDWNIVEGAFFDCWATEQHVIKPFPIPNSWPRFRAMDWGSYSPFCVGWYAIVNEDYRLPNGKILPRGAMVKYREWYGTSDPSTGGAKGLKLFGGAAGEGIAKREKNGPRLVGAVLDPSTFKQDGAPPVAEEMNKALMKEGCMPFRKADNTRVTTRDSKDRRGPMSGWDQLRARLIGRAHISEKDGSVDWSRGRPMLYFFETCIASIRTIPVLQHDPVKPEDIATNSEDHAGDETRYACNSRPWARSLEVPEDPKGEAYHSASDDAESLGMSSVKTI